MLSRLPMADRNVAGHQDRVSNYLRVRDGGDDAAGAFLPQGLERSRDAAADRVGGFAARHGCGVAAL